MQTTPVARLLRVAALAVAPLAVGFGAVEEATAQDTSFQLRKALTCTGNPTNCRANFAPVADGKRMRIEFVSCFLDTLDIFGPNKAAFLGVDNAFSGPTFRHTLLWEIRETSGRRITVVSQPIDITVFQTRRPDISIPFPAGGVTATGECSISGTLTTLP